MNCRSIVSYRRGSDTSIAEVRHQMDRSRSTKRWPVESTSRASRRAHIILENPTEPLTTANPPAAIGRRRAVGLRKGHVGSKSTREGRINIDIQADDSSRLREAAQSYARWLLSTTCLSLRHH